MLMNFGEQIMKWDYFIIQNRIFTIKYTTVNKQKSILLNVTFIKQLQN